MFPSAGPSADAAIPGKVPTPAVAPASSAVSKASPETRLGDGDRDTIDLPDYVPGLSPAQVTAMAALLDGKSATHAAVMAGVKRVTVYRWQYFHPEFAAALNSFRRQQYAEFSARFSAMQEKVLSVMEALLNKQDFRVVKLYFSFIEKQRIGPGTPEGVSRRLARPHQRAADAAIKPVLTASRLPTEIREDLMIRYFKHDNAAQNLDPRPGGRLHKT
jgi:hypothetical protein